MISLINMSISHKAISEYKQLLIKKGLFIPEEESLAIEAEKMLVWAASFMRSIPKREMEAKNVKE